MNEEKDKKIIEKVGDLPVNSRIYINYNENPPKITFGYPDTNADQITWSSATLLVATFITLVVLLILTQAWFFVLNNYIYPDIGPGNITINNAEVGRFSTNYSDPNATHYGFSAIYVNYTWHNQEYHSTLTISKGGFLWYTPYFIDKRESDRSFSLAMQICVIYFLMIVFLIFMAKLVTKFFSKTKFGNKTFPQFNKFLHDRHYSAEFTTEDFPPDKNVIELPMFKNMYMDYEATGEFSKYLTNISIVEHPFSRYVKKRGKPYARIRRIAKKKKDAETYNATLDKKINIYLWKAVFEFSERPKDGKLFLKWT